MTTEGSVQRKSCEKIEDEKAEEVETPSYLDGGYGWVIVFASFGVNFVNMGLVCSLGVIFEQILDEFKGGSAYTSWILSLMSAFTAIISPLTSYLVGIYGFRRVTICGGIIGAVSLLVSYFAQNVFTLIITIGLGSGCGLGLTILPSVVVVNTYFEKYRSTAVGIVVAGAGVGTSICAPITAHLSDEYGWRFTLVFLSGMVSLCAVFGSFYRPIRTPETDNDSPDQTNECKEELDSVESQPKNFDLHELEVTSNVYSKKDTTKSTILGLFKDPIVMLMAISSLFACIGYFVPYFCLTSLATEVGLTKQEGSYLISVLGASNMIGRIFWGYISDKPFVNRLWVYVSSLLISGTATIACVFGAGFLALAAYSTVFGFVVSAYVSLQSVLLSDLVGIERLNYAFGIVLLFEGVGTFLGPLGVGFFHDLMKSYLHGFVFAGGFMCLGGLLPCFVPILRKRASKKYQEYKVAAKM